MTVRELLEKLICCDPEARVFVDCSGEYPECGEVTSARIWGEEISEEEKTGVLKYGWTKPGESDVLLL